MMITVSKKMILWGCSIIWLLWLWTLSLSYADTILSSNLVFPPEWKWKKLTTQHANITFPEHLLDAATVTAKTVEAVYPILSAVLNYPEHHTKVPFILTDQSDLSNGLTAVIERFGILLYVTPPQQYQGLEFYDSWLKRLIIHEYTHFLQMDTTFGVWRALRYIFGEQITSNSLLPHWILEGSAVWVETFFTASGRGRGNYYDSILRVHYAKHQLRDIGEDRFFYLDDLAIAQPQFPFGDIIYQLGYHLLLEMDLQAAEPFKIEPVERPIGAFSKISGAFNPLEINNNAYDAVQRTWYDLWDSFLARTKKRLALQMDILTQHPVTEPIWLTSLDPQKGHQVFGQQVSHTQQAIFYTASTNEKRIGLYQYDLQTKNIKHLEDKFLGTTIHVMQHEPYLLMSEVRVLDQFRTFEDLKIFDLKKQKSFFLTKGLRISEPHFHEVSKKIVFLQVIDQTHYLKEAQLVKKKDTFVLENMRVLYAPQERYTGLALPHYALDGKSVYFTYHTEGSSHSVLARVDTTTLQVWDIVKNKALNYHPIDAADGYLYYLSDITGINNIYRIPTDRLQYPPEMMTNVIGNIRFFSLDPKDPKKAYATLLDTTGWQLAHIKFLDAPIREFSSLTIPPPLAKKSFEKSPIDYAASTPMQVEDYSIWSSLLPRAWTPSFSLSQGSQNVSLTTRGYDNTGMHQYQATATYFFIPQNLDGEILYENRKLGFPVKFSAGLYHYINAQDVQTGLLQRQVQLSLGSSVLFPFPSTFSAITPFMGVSGKYIGANSIAVKKTAEKTFAVQAGVGVDLNFLESAFLAPKPVAGFASGMRIDGVFKPYFSNMLLNARIQKFFRVGKLNSFELAAKGAATLWRSDLYSDNFVQTVGFDYYSASSAQQVLYQGLDFLFLESIFSGALNAALHMPIWQIYRGLWTWPIFFQSLYLSLISENALMVNEKTTQGTYRLHSAGVAATLRFSVLDITINFETNIFYMFWPSSDRPFVHWNVPELGALSFNAKLFTGTHF